MGRRPKDLTSMYEAAEARRSCVAALGQGQRRLLERHVVADGLVSPSPNLYVRRSTWEGLDPNQRALYVIHGLAQLHPSWVFCRTSSALVHGLRVSFSCSRKVYALVGRGQGAPSPSEVPVVRRASKAPRVVLIHGSDSRDETVIVDGVRVTNLDETVVACLCTLGFCQGLVVADSYLWVSKTDSTSLLRLVEERRKGLPGVRAARLTASFADPRAESGGESYARGRMIELGYAIPDLQVAFAGTLGESDMRADFLWHLPDGRVVAGELDGMEKYTNPAMSSGTPVAKLLVEQNMRDTRLGVHVDSVLHFTYDIVRDTARFCALLDAYGIPRKPGQWQTRPRRHERRRRGLRGRRMELAGGGVITCYVIDGPAMRR